MSSMVELARQQWADGHRRLGELREHPQRHRRLLELTEVVNEQLRRRVGGVYDLAELVDAYRASDSWLRDALAEAEPGGEASADAALAADVAFHLYSRGARDYVP